MRPNSTAAAPNTACGSVRCTHTYETGPLYRHAMLTYLNWVGLTHGARQERVEVSLRPRRTPAHYLTKSKCTSLSRPGEILGGVGACRALGRKLPNSPLVYRPFIEMSEKLWASSLYLYLPKGQVTWHAQSYVHFIGDVHQCIHTIALQSLPAQPGRAATQPEKIPRNTTVRVSRTFFWRFERLPTIH